MGTTKRLSHGLVPAVGESLLYKGETLQNQILGGFSGATNGAKRQGSGAGEQKKAAESPRLPLKKGTKQKRQSIPISDTVPVTKVVRLKKIKLSLYQVERFSSL